MIVQNVPLRFETMSIYTTNPIHVAKSSWLYTGPRVHIEP